MDFDTYQEQAATTALYPAETGMAYTVLGLVNEAGEVAGKLKKYLRGDYNQAMAKASITAELGDVLWYLAMVSKEIDVPLSLIAERNITKLRDRAERNVIKGDGDER